IPLEGVPIDWSSARRASYQITQSFRYEYPAPIRDLSHRLVVIPPERFGDQKRLRHRVSAGIDGVRFENRQDRFGNVIVDVFAPRVSSAIEFLAEITVERSSAEPNRLPAGWQRDAYLLEASRLTAADERLQQAADELAESAPWGLDLADRINDWVYQSMTYRGGVTGVRTTASEALALGFGVCQDYAHIMLAVCRAAKLPARYASGHLVGQGGTHAWVEVVLPAEDETGDAIAWAFDPTHASRGGLEYVTIAVGADYLDVAPTSGTYVSQATGRLLTHKRVTLTDLEYAI
ncbi:MAG: transglutaminase family protein, partial [Candidatus Dormibacteraeota bacterium]|nr:transglutaminase family protein [Candidatus Dormibacteraeota bacterium]